MEGRTNGSAEKVDGIPRIATLPRNDSNNTVAQHDTTAEGIGTVRMTLLEIFDKRKEID